jgi:hypothetical protein
MIDSPTPEKIDQNYKAAMDSVNLINGGKPENMTDADWADALKRNKEHLQIMLAKDFWTNEDLTPLQTAASVQAQINNQINQPVVSPPLPWAN